MLGVCYTVMALEMMLCQGPFGLQLYPQFNMLTTAAWIDDVFYFQALIIVYSL